MMIRNLTLSIAFAVFAAPAYAQDSEPVTTPSNPNTTETDQSEEDWRNSQKRRDSGDIFKDIVSNPNSTGSGGIWGGDIKAIDQLSTESRRHLNRQRAKALAETEPGEPIEADYEPSEAAKTDEYIGRQEQKAWEEMLEEANRGAGILTEAPSGPGQGGSGAGGSGPSGAGQGGTGQSGQNPAGQNPLGQGQAGGQGQSDQNISGQGQGGGQGGPSQGSPLRGGSANSASDILNQIRGISGGSGQGGPSGSSGQGTAQTQGQQAGGGQSDGQSDGQGDTQGESQPAGAQQAGQGQASGQSTASGDAQSQGEPSSDAQAQAQAQAESQAQAQADAASQAQADATAAEAAAHRETISPLERLKRDPVERAGTGGRTSASDYLNRTK